MFEWIRKRKARIDPDLKMIDIKKLGLREDPMINSTVTVPSYPSPMITAANVPSSVGNITTYIGSGNAGIGASMISNNLGIGGNFAGQFINTPQSNIITIQGGTKEIVRITNKGEVEWPNGCDDATIDEASKALASSLRLGTEIAAGVRANVKQKIRDAVFEEVIDIAKQKGALTAEDLTYLWQSAKIVDKLKGII